MHRRYSPSGASADPDAPVALVYGHHDVQPVDPPELWVHPPFEPTRVDGPDGPELHARGAIDDKGNVAFHLLGMRAHLAATGRDTPAVTVKLLIEGEEESGSPHFAALLEEKADRLACDVVVVSDTGMAAPDVPSAVTAMRGLADAEITLRGPAVDLHSGLLRRRRPQSAARHGPAAGRSARRAGPRHPARLLRQGPPAVATASATSWAGCPSTSRPGSPGRRPRGRPTARRASARWSAPAPGPTAEVNGLWGGYTGPGHKTIIPAEAHAKVTFRLVADQRPEDVGPQLRAWVEANLPAGIEADVHTPPGGVAPCSSDLDSPWMAALLSAIGQAFDTDPAEVLFTREGGSGPEADLVEHLGAPLLFLGAGLPTDRIHSPNERVLLPMLYRGAEAAAHLWRELASVRLR